MTAVQNARVNIRELLHEAVKSSQEVCVDALQLGCFLFNRLLVNVQAPIIDCFLQLRNFSTRNI